MYLAEIKARQAQIGPEWSRFKSDLQSMHNLNPRRRFFETLENKVRNVLKR